MLRDTYSRIKKNIKSRLKKRNCALQILNAKRRKIITLSKPFLNIKLKNKKDYTSDKLYSRMDVQGYT